MAGYRLAGEVFAGTVTEAWPDRLDTSGKRAKLRPWVALETAGQVLAAPGAMLTCPARPGQDAQIIEVTPMEQLSRVILQLSGGMGRSLVPLPGSVPVAGETLTYTTLRDDFQPVSEVP